MSLGTKIADLRQRAGMSQDTLAERLEVSRQSVSKWETDASVPELEKLVRLAEIFGVSLDELILGKPPECTPERAEPVPVPPEPVAVGGRSMTGARLAGIIILIVAGVATLLGLFLAGFGILFLTVPLCLPGILCLVCKKRPALWAVWSVVLMVEAYLAAATGTAVGELVVYLWHPELLKTAPPAAPWVSGALLIVDVLMVLWTVRSFRQTVLPRNAKTVSLAAGLWLLRLIVLPTVSRLVIRKLSLLPTAPIYQVGKIMNILNIFTGLTSLPLLTAAVTVTVLLVKKRTAEA